MIKKILLSLLLTFCLILCCTNIVFAENEESKINEPSSLYAVSAALIDGESGRVLFSKNKDKILPMASTTKIMTCIVALENGNLEDTVTISKDAAKMPDVQLNANSGEQYKLEDLLYSLMLESHNDSAYAIAEHIGGDVKKFAQMMNDKAKEIGCKHTYFITPNGLDATDEKGTHSTTAIELASMMRYCINLSPKKEDFLKITRQSSYSFSDLSGKRSFTCNNHNAFLNMMDGALSGKTGFTSQAGYCYVGALEKDGKKYIVSLLACGWPNNKTYKWTDTRKLMNYGLDYYEFCSFDSIKIDKNKLIPIIVNNGQTEKIGKTATVDLVVQEETSKASMNPTLNATKNNGLLLREDESVKIKYNLKKQLTAPVKKGQLAGTIQYIIGDEVWKTDIITANHTIDKIDYKWCFYQISKMFLIG